MYLMNVPPVAATHTKWRTCGPPGGYSLPICFNDSDTELSTRGTPISDKVQMIIESLRSTQSSLEMGDEIEGNVLSGQEGHPQVCKVAVGSFVGAKSKTKGPTENQQAGVSSPVDHESIDSDSDDSVDRGIEEAILEYLKEKDDHKRKAEPCATFLQTSKIPRKTPPIPEVSKQNSDSNTFLIASNQFPKSIKAETPTAPAVIPIKKYIKNKAFLNDNMVKKLESNKTAKSLLPAKEQTKSPSKTISLLNKTKSPDTVMVEEDSNDSSSDDGIEEAIQRYQLEQKEQQNRREAFKEDSDSTSDDGIEEAIRSYQLEQLKEKVCLKPFLQKQKPINKSLIQAVGSTSTEHTKKHKLSKKKNRAEREVKSVLPSVFIPKNTLSDSPRGKGNGLLSLKGESFKEQPTPAPPKANTTAELMCAEAILDISKTVMPVTFHHSVGLSSCALNESSVQCSLPDNCPDDESDGSSVDSEDGIEQEIRKFLEQKAQMHNNKPPSSAVTQEPKSLNEPEKMKPKQVVTQKKPPRLSLTQRRKHKQENRNISNVPGIDDVKDAAPKPLHEHRRESSPLVFSQKSQPQPIAGLHNTDQSGDKSSSLDSDEDLDTAIKDLLKTKKKSKKKPKDLKRKSRKCLKEEEPALANALQSKKLKPDPISKRSALKKVHKSKDDMKDKSTINKKIHLQPTQTNKSQEHNMHEDKMEKLKGTEDHETPLLYNTQTPLHIKEDSSSVDSDDSIEQEIRRFLAEKAKVSTAEKSIDKEVSGNGTVMVGTPRQDEDVKQENQLAEIPRKSITPLSGQSPLSSPESKPPQDRPPLPTPMSLLPASSVYSVSAQSRLSCSPGLLEPADGAGAARSEQRRPTTTTGRGDTQDVTPQTQRVRPVLTPNIAHLQSIKWRQSLGLPTSDTRTLSRTPFHITSSKISEGASATPYQGRGINLKSQTPVTVWSSARTSRAPFACTTEKTVNTAFRPPVLNFLSAARQLPGMSFTPSLALGQRSQRPAEGETESMVHMSKDKSVFVELESDRTNHVQVRSRERSEGKQRADLLSDKKREGESMKTDGKEAHLERTEEEFIDEADCESDNRRNPETKQGFSTLSLSSAIDPGITFSPCIALTTEERSMRFNRRYLTEKYKKATATRSNVPVKTVQHVKRKLQFIPVHRRNEACVRSTE